ncbi:MAG: SDR family NAD(P)-dependent oxidoreductase [Chloroflexota bacterium]|nr:SDR family NAD(P)-dependent oxidoreductase [Chloroflexota bacterium]
MPPDAQPGRLAGQVAVVTGAGKGIGRAIASAFAAEGARVVLADIDAEAASAAAATLSSSGGSALAVPTDVTSPGAQDALFARVAEVFERLDVLVNNAGVFHVAPLLDFPLEAWRRVFAVNVDGALLATQRAARVMQAQDPHPVTGCRGKILNISSGAAERGRPFLPAYGASKAALNHLSKSSALVLGPHAIATTVLYPTSVREGMFGPIAEQMAGFEGMRAEEFSALRAAGSPLGRLQAPEEVGVIAVWVAAHVGMHLNGQLVHTEAHVASLP